MEQYGEHVAGNTLGRLYSDVDRIHRNMPRYDPTEVLGWLGRMEGGLEAYAARMSSMCASAIDQESFERLSAGLRDRGCTTLRAEPLTAAEQDVPLAWVLIATKGSLQAQQQKNATGQENSADTVQRGKEKLQIWIKQQVDGAIRELTRSHAFASFLVEAKPAWVLPFQILIGRVRERGGRPDRFDWFICGEVPTDLISSKAASTPREAARFFSLKWQGEAALKEELPAGQSADPTGAARSEDLHLAEQAEALYALTDDPSVWPPESND